MAVSPFSSVYETADGRYVAVAAVEPQFYAALLEGLGLEEAMLPPREDRARWPELRTAIAAAFRRHTRREWTDLLEGYPCVCLAGTRARRGRRAPPDRGASDARRPPLTRRLPRRHAAAHLAQSQALAQDRRRTPLLGDSGVAARTIEALGA